MLHIQKLSDDRFVDSREILSVPFLRRSINLVTQNIEVKSDVPGVGKNLRDHPAVSESAQLLITFSADGFWGRCEIRVR